MQALLNDGSATFAPEMAQTLPECLSTAGAVQEYAAFPCAAALRVVCMMIYVLQFCAWYILVYCSFT